MNDSSRVNRRAHSANGQLTLPLNTIGASTRSAPVGRQHVVAGLFAGIGGIELGLHRRGHRTALFCENEPTAMAVLSTRFPGVPLHSDVRSLKSLPRDTSLVTAGFPCQDLSQAGMTKGIAGTRSSLVGEVFRLIADSRVPWVLLENVPFMLQLGRGEAMNLIATTFERLGYRWAFRVVDSRAFGLPQRRRRVYFLATTEGDPRSVLFSDEYKAPDEPVKNGNAVACGFYWTEGLRGLGWAVDAVPTLKGGSTIGIPSPPAIIMPDRSIVTPGIEDAERLQGFPRNWTKPAETVARPGARWKLVGNAVSVRAAAWIGRRLRHPGILREYQVSSLSKRKTWPTAAWNVGDGRVAVECSEWPVHSKYTSLETLLTVTKLRRLSAKATRGFLSRAGQGKLRFPDGFISAVEKHLRTVSKDE